MLVLHRKHTCKPPRPVTGTTLTACVEGDQLQLSQYSDGPRSEGLGLIPGRGKTHLVGNNGAPTRWAKRPAGGGGLGSRVVEICLHPPCPHEVCIIREKGTW
jgi:hypothetical protein